jgi:hypothetical protein
MIFGAGFVAPAGGKFDLGKVFVTFGAGGKVFVTFGADVIGAGGVLMIFGP